MQTTNPNKVNSGLELLAEFYDFLKSPYLPQDTLGFRAQYIFPILIVYAAVFSVSILIMSPLAYFIGLEEIPHAMNDMVDNIPKVMFFGMVVLLAPLVEEFFFRFPLRYRLSAILLLGAMLLLFFSLVFVHFLNIYFAIVAALIPTAIIIYFLFFQAQDTEFSFQKYYPLIFYASVVLFAFMHVYNFELSAIEFWYTPVLVIPQFCLALLLGFVRLKFGFWACVFLHGVNNLWPTMLFLMNPDMM